MNQPRNRTGLLLSACLPQPLCGSRTPSLHVLRLMYPTSSYRPNPFGPFSHPAKTTRTIGGAPFEKDLTAGAKVPLRPALPFPRLPLPRAKNSIIIARSPLALPRYRAPARWRPDARSPPPPRRSPCGCSPSGRSGSGSSRSALAPACAHVPARCARRSRFALFRWSWRTRSDSDNPTDRALACHAARSALLARIFTQTSRPSLTMLPLSAPRLGVQGGMAPFASPCRGSRVKSRFIWLRRRVCTTPELL